MLDRRSFLGISATLSISYAMSACYSVTKVAINEVEYQEAFAQLESELKGRLGVYAIDIGSGSCIEYRSNELFPFCSTFKAMLAANILFKSKSESELLHRRIIYSGFDIVPHSPVTEKYIQDGMTVFELCGAMMTVSDNTAANLLLNVIGGPTALNGFMRSSLGDKQFRLDRFETDLNSSIPNDPRDTSTPRAMAQSLKKIVLGDLLTHELCAQFKHWLGGNIAGNRLIQAGVPPNWKVADRSGGGRYGTRNDIALISRPSSPPIILAIYTTQNKENAEWREDIVASATRIVVSAFP